MATACVNKSEPPRPRPPVPPPSHPLRRSALLHTTLKNRMPSSYPVPSVLSDGAQPVGRARWCFYHQGCSAEAIVGAARNGHLSMVKLLHRRRPEQCRCCLTARAIAAANGHVEVARWLDNSDPEMVQALEEAVGACSIDSGGGGSSGSGLGPAGDDTGGGSGNMAGDDGRENTL